MVKDDPVQQTNQDIQHVQCFNRNEELQDLRDAFFLIEVTGRDGFPVYATGRLDQGSFVREVQNDNTKSKPHWKVDLVESTDVKCNMQEISFVEVHLGHRLLLKLGNISNVGWNMGPRRTVNGSIMQDLVFGEGEFPNY